jgi:hypothetical protein
MAANDLNKINYSDSRQPSGQQPPNVTLNFDGVLCGSGTLGTHAAKVMASRCPDSERQVG